MKFLLFTYKFDLLSSKKLCYLHFQHYADNYPAYV